MSKSKKTTNFSSDVMKSIKTDDIKMKSKNYYLGLTISLLAGSLAFIGLAALAISLISYDDAVGDDIAASGLGPSSSQMPALILTLLMILVGLTGSVWILRKFRVGYRQRYAAVYLAVLIIVGLFAIASVQTGIAEDLSSIKPLEPLAPYSRELKDRVLIGEVITSVESDVQDSFKIRGPRQQEITIIIDANTEFKPKYEINTGDKIMIKGNRLNPTTMEADLIIINPPQHHYNKLRPKFMPGEIKPHRLMY